MIQKIFKQEYAELLEENIASNVPLYTPEGFAYDPNAVVDGNFDGDSNLLNDMLPHVSSKASEEVEAAIILYESFKELNPLQASYKPFWLYLSHVELYPYMYKRWLQTPSESISSMADYIDSHWFYKDGKLRSHLEGMYWLVRKSVVLSEDGYLDYEYTRFLFSRRVLGDRGIAARQFIFMNDKVFKGVLKYIMDNENTIFEHHMQARATYCAKLLNQKGGVVDLSAWAENDVKSFLDPYREKIMEQDND